MNSQSAMENNLKGLLQSMGIDMNESLRSLTSIISQPKKKLESLLQKYIILGEQKAHISTESGVKDPKPEDRIKLNVSGRIMEYNRSVFLEDPDSLLAGIFSGRWDKAFPKDKSGRFFLNENPAYFRYILNSLAGFPSNASSQFVNNPTLKSMIDRYGIHGLLDEKRAHKKPRMTEQQNEETLTSTFPTLLSPNSTLDTTLLEIAQSFRSQLALVENLSKRYEIDVLNFEKEVTLMNEIIDDGEEVLELDVGGEYIATTRATLQMISDSMLSVKFDSSKWSLQENKDIDSNGNVVMDADPTIFHLVLDYLRLKKTGQEEIFYCQISDGKKEAFEKTLKYLFPGNTEIEKAFVPQIDSNLLSSQHLPLVMQWCIETVSLPTAKLNLFYRASRDGWSHDDFIGRCGGKNNTLLVISANGGIFGGFSNLCWSGIRYSKFYSNADAFLFSLIPPSSYIGTREPAKLPRKQNSQMQRNGVFRMARSGSRFVGFGCQYLGRSERKFQDLVIFEHANSHSQSCAFPGHGYAIPQTFTGDDTKTYFAGSSKFSVQEIECFCFE